MFSASLLCVRACDCALNSQHVYGCEGASFWTSWVVMTNLDRQILGCDDKPGQTDIGLWVVMTNLEHLHAPMLFRMCPSGIYNQAITLCTV